MPFWHVNIVGIPANGEYVDLWFYHGPCGRSWGLALADPSHSWRRSLLVPSWALTLPWPWAVLPVECGFSGCSNRATRGAPWRSWGTDFWSTLLRSLETGCAENTPHVRPVWITICPRAHCLSERTLQLGFQVPVSKKNSSAPFFKEAWARKTWPSELI